MGARNRPHTHTHTQTHAKLMVFQPDAAALLEPRPFCAFANNDRRQICAASAIAIVSTVMSIARIGNLHVIAVVVDRRQRRALGSRLHTHFCCAYYMSEIGSCDDDRDHTHTNGATIIKPSTTRVVHHRKHSS